MVKFKFPGLDKAVEDFLQLAINVSEKQLDVNKRNRTGVMPVKFLLTAHGNDLIQHFGFAHSAVL